MFQKYNPTYKSATTVIEQRPQQKDSFETNPNFEKLQTDYNSSLQRVQNLEKHNMTLSNKVKEYAVLYTEEKEEKREYQKKLDATNQKLIDKVETFALEKIRLERKYHILFSFFTITGLAIIRMQIPEILEAFTYFSK